MSNEIGYIAALSAGFFSFLSPCVLPLVPAYLGFIAGVSYEELSSKHYQVINNRLKIVFPALGFVFGFSVIFIIMGASASIIHSLIFQHISFFSKIAGILIIIFGLHYLGVFRFLGILNLLQKDVRFQFNTTPIRIFGSFIIGAAFAFGWTPCIGPILGAILLLAGSGESLVYGVSLLSVYSLGLGIPFLIAALAFPTFVRLSNKFRNYLQLMEKIAGSVLVITGGAIFFDKLSVVGFYLLNIFPILENIG